MKKILQFIHNNAKILIGVLGGVILGYLYWYYIGCYWGTYPLSAECWVNCSYGGILGGFVMSLFNRDNWKKTGDEF